MESTGPRKRARSGDRRIESAPEDRLLSIRSLERHAAAIQSYHDAFKRNPQFQAVNVDWGLGPYHARLKQWMVETNRAKRARDVDEDKSWRLMEDLYDFALEFNSLKLGIEYYTTPVAPSPAEADASSNRSDVAERVWRATHSGDWSDVSVVQERRR